MFYVLQKLVQDHPYLKYRRSGIKGLGVGFSFDFYWFYVTISMDA